MILGALSMLVLMLVRWDSESPFSPAIHPTHSYFVEWAIDRLKGTWPELQTYRSPLAETYAALYDSAAWAEHENAVASAVPLDVWREGCWRFVVFPARVDGRDLEVVFAVSTAERSRTVRAALVPAPVATAV